MSALSKFWDSAAKKYAAQPVSNEATYAATLASVRTHLTTTSRVLEIGCGTGSTVLKLAPYAGSILGTDFSPAMISICNEKLKAASASQSDSKPNVSGVKFAVGDICRPDGHEASDKGTYDVVLAFNLLYLLEDGPSALGNVNRLLKPGGLFISKNIVQDGMTWKYKILGKAVPLMAWVGLAPSGISFQTSTELEDSMKGKGFEIVQGTFPKDDEQRRYVVARKTKEA